MARAAESSETAHGERGRPGRSAERRRGGATVALSMCRCVGPRRSSSCRDRPRRRTLAALPVVMAAVPVRQLGLAEIEVVEAVEVDPDVVAAEDVAVAKREAVNAAVLAELAARDPAAPLVGRQAVLALQQRERGGLRDRADGGDLGADGAVAHAAGRRVDLDLEADR